VLPRRPSEPRPIRSRQSSITTNSTIAPAASVAAHGPCRERLHEQIARFCAQERSGSTWA
jgi:hypothetical protein